MKKILIFLLLISPAICYSQKRYNEEAWESGYWKKVLKNKADSNTTYKEYYKSGNLKIVGDFKNGIPFGTWTFFNKHGRIFSEINYNDTSIYYKPYKSDSIEYSRLTGLHKWC